MDLVERDIIVRFLRGAASAKSLVEVNISAGIALQELGAEPAEVEEYDENYELRKWWYSEQGSA